MKKLITVISMVLAAGIIYAGTSSIDILKISPGIRSQGMGGAYTALSGDAEGMDINPAGMAYITSHDILLIHDIYLDDVFYDSVYYAQPLGDAGVLGVSGKFLSGGVITQTTEDATGHFASEAGTVSAYNFLAGAGYAFKLEKIDYNDFTKNTGVGVDLKITGEGIGADYGNFALSADVGIIHTIPLAEQDIMSRGEFAWEKIGLGFVCKNLGTSFNGEVTPMAFTFGAYTQMKNAFVENNRVRLSTDFDYGFESSVSIKYGMEYLHRIENYSLALRAGGKLNTVKSIYDGFNIGAGLGIDMGGVSYTVDYVFIPFGALGNNSKIGLYISF